MDLDSYLKDLQDVANNYVGAVNEFVSIANSKGKLLTNPIDAYVNELYSTGTNIKRSYTENTKARKRKGGYKMTETVNLFDTGDLHSNMFIKFEDNELKMDSKGINIAEVKIQYGDDVLDFHDNSSLVAASSFDTFIEQKLNKESTISLDFPNLKKI